MRVPSWKAHGPPEGRQQIRNPLSDCTAPHCSSPSYQPLNTKATDAQNAFELHCSTRWLKIKLKMRQRKDRDKDLGLLMEAQQTERRWGAKRDRPEERSPGRSRRRWKVSPWEERVKKVVEWSISAAMDERKTELEASKGRGSTEGKRTVTSAGDSRINKGHVFIFLLINKGIDGQITLDFE